MAYLRELRNTWSTMATGGRGGGGSQNSWAKKIPDGFDLLTEKIP